jgi:hypothetical protein
MSPPSGPGPSRVRGKLRRPRADTKRSGVVIMGDIAVTLVDLIQRGLLAVEETADGGDWLLTPLGELPLGRSTVPFSIMRSGCWTG